jgi:hypothetical protein
MQPTQKYLLLVAIRYYSILLLNTHYRCDYATAHAGHVMFQPARPSLSVVPKQSNYKDVFFYKCIDCSLSNATWHVLLT